MNLLLWYMVVGLIVGLIDHLLWLYDPYDPGLRYLLEDSDILTQVITLTTILLFSAVVWPAIVISVILEVMGFGGKDD